MNKAGRVADYLGHILQAMARIERHTAGVDAAGFAASELIQDAVIRNLEVLARRRTTFSGSTPRSRRCTPKCHGQ